ncbi:MAG: polymer-forming cytoskeletal protein [Anaerolineaceae bacterium]|nr:polymer-forming cytoskeletal protein [Anaerolineaceae bacterium]
MSQKISKKLLTTIFISVLGIALVLGITVPVQASYHNRGGHIQADEVIDEDVFMGSETVVIDGVINGSLMAGGQTITINGEINGDAFLAANKIYISKTAKIAGNLFLGCQTAEIDGQVEGSVFGGSTSLLAASNAVINRSLYYGGYSLELQPDAKIQRNINAGVYQAILSGEVERNVNLGAGAVELNGDIGGNVNIDFGPDEISKTESPVFFFPGMNFEMPKSIQPGLRVNPTANIGGQLTYTAFAEDAAAINAQPVGGVVYQTPVPSETKEGGETAATASRVKFVTPLVNWALKTLRNFATLLILGALALWLLPALLGRLVNKIKEKPAPSAGYGFVVVIIGYAAAIFAALVVLMVGILFMVVTLGGISSTVFTIGFSSVALALAIFGLLVSYGSKLIVAYLAGQWILRQLSPGAAHASIWAMLIGIILYTLLRSLPFIGWLFGLVITFLGIGAIWLVYRDWKTSRQAAPLVLPAEN